MGNPFAKTCKTFVRTCPNPTLTHPPASHDQPIRDNILKWVLFGHPNLASRNQTWVSNPDRSQIAQWTFTRMAKASASKPSASASRSEAVREAFPKPKPGVERFSGVRIRRWRVFHWQNLALESFPVVKPCKKDQGPCKTQGLVWQGQCLDAKGWRSWKKGLDQ